MVAFRVVILDGPGAGSEIEARELGPAGAEVARATGDSPDEVLALVSDADAILCDTTTIDPALLDRAPKVQVVVEYGIGYDNIDVAAASQRGIWVANVPGFCVDEVADHAMALVLAANRYLLALDRSVRSGQWDTLAVASVANRLAHQTIGLVGFGQIGRRVARRASGFGPRILAYSRSLTSEMAREHGAERADLAELYRQSDYVSLHVPGGPPTRDLIDRSALSLFQPGAWLINTSRGSIVDEAALLDALKNGRLAGAALDVRQAEPPPRGDPFRDLANVILTPHAAFYSRASLAELRQRAARNVAAVLTGGMPNDPVNPYIKPRFGREAPGDGMWV